MSDRELLTLAAKAAGIIGEPGAMAGYAGIVVRKWPGGHTTGEVWNPLEDDGDALRLAVRLGFAVSVEFQVGSTAVLWGPPMGTAREAHGDDASAATRRAIVRAAAEIGGRMP